LISVECTAYYLDNDSSILSLKDKAPSKSKQH